MQSKLKIQTLFKPITALLFMLLIFAIGNICAYAKDAETEEASGFIGAYSQAMQYFPEDGSKSMSREQFINVATEVFGKNLSKQEVSFDDVDVGAPIYESLQKTVAAGWVSDGRAFRPTDAITLDEALKICCSVAGYDIYADLCGGYPVGYRLAAKRAKLTEHVESGIKLTGDDVLMLIWNTLNAEILKQTGFGSDDIRFDTNGETVMETILDVYYEEGIMNANEYSRLEDKADTGEDGRIEINGSYYKVTNKVLNDHLGYYVRAYYIKHDNDKNGTINFVYPVDNKVLSVNLKNATYIPAERTVEYTEEKTLKAKLNKTFQYIYNGRAYFDAGNNILPENGMLILIDNNNDGIYDVVSVTEYTYLTVNFFNKYYNTISDQYESDKDINLTEASCGYTYTSLDGIDLQLMNLKSGAVLAVAASKDKLLIRMMLCNESKTAPLQEKNTDDETLIFEDSKYELSSEIAAQILSYKLNTEYQFVLGVYGEIVSMKPQSERWMYAYLKKAYVSNDLNSKLNVSLFTENGDHLTAVGDDKIIVNNRKYTNEEVYTILLNGGAVKPQLIRCLMTDENVLKGIAFAETVTQLPLTNEKEDDKLKKMDFGVDTFYYRQSHFYPYFNALGAIVFKVPTDVDKEKFFEVGYSFSDGNKSLSVYDVGLNGSAGAVVYVSSDSDDNIVAMISTTPIMLIESVHSALDEEGNTTKKISGWSDGSFVEYLLDCDLDGSDLASGNVIRYRSQNDKIVCYNTDFVEKTMTPTADISSNFNMKTTAAFAYIGGNLYFSENGFAYLTNTVDANGIYDTSVSKLINVKLPSMAKCIVYERKTGKIRPADSSYLQSIVSNGNDAACYLLVRSNYLSNQYAIIYLP